LSTTRIFDLEIQITTKKKGTTEAVPFRNSIELSPSSLSLHP
jgi:hypothetical protein